MSRLLCQDLGFSKFPNFEVSEQHFVCPLCSSRHIFHHCLIVLTLRSKYRSSHRNTSPVQPWRANMADAWNQEASPADVWTGIRSRRGRQMTLSPICRLPGEMTGRMVLLTRHSTRMRKTKDKKTWNHGPKHAFGPLPQLSRVVSAACYLVFANIPPTTTSIMAGMTRIPARKLGTMKLGAMMKFLPPLQRLRLR